jgi:hypothetical protein
LRGVNARRVHASQHGERDRHDRVIDDLLAGNAVEREAGAAVGERA